MVRKCPVLLLPHILKIPITATKNAVLTNSVMWPSRNTILMETPFVWILNATTHKQENSLALFKKPFLTMMNRMKNLRKNIFISVLYYNFFFQIFKQTDVYFTWLNPNGRRYQELMRARKLSVNRNTENITTLEKSSKSSQQKTAEEMALAERIVISKWYFKFFYKNLQFFIKTWL